MLTMSGPRDLHGTHEHTIVYESMMLRYNSGSKPSWTSLYGVLVDFGATAELRLFQNVQESVSEHVSFSASETISVRSLRKISQSSESFPTVVLPTESSEGCFFVRYLDSNRIPVERCFKTLRQDTAVKWLRALKILAKRDLARPAAVEPPINNTTTAEETDAVAHISTHAGIRKRATQKHKPVKPPSMEDAKKHQQNPSNKQRGAAALKRALRAKPVQRKELHNHAVRRTMRKFKKFLKTEEGHRSVLREAAAIAGDELTRTHRHANPDEARITKDHVTLAHRSLFQKAKENLVTSASSPPPHSEPRHVSRSSRRGQDRPRRRQQSQPSRRHRHRPELARVSPSESNSGSDSEFPSSSTSGAPSHRRDGTPIHPHVVTTTPQVGDTHWWKRPEADDGANTVGKQGLPQPSAAVSVPLSYIEQLTSPAVSQKVKKQLGRSLRRRAGLGELPTSPQYVLPGNMKMTANTNATTPLGSAQIPGPPRPAPQVQAPAQTQTPVQDDTVATAPQRAMPDPHSPLTSVVQSRKAALRRNASLSYLVDDHEMSQVTKPLRVGYHTVATYNDTHFAAVRQSFGVDPDFLAAERFSLEPFLDSLTPDTEVVWSADRNFVVKCLSPSDHQRLVASASLLPSCFEDGLESLTLIVPIFAHFRIRRGESDGPNDLVAIATGRCLPSAAPDFTWGHNLFQFTPAASRRNKALGVHSEETAEPIANGDSSDVVSEFGEAMRIKCNPRRVTFALTPDQRHSLLRVLRGDTAKLSEMGFGGYALVVGYYEVASEKMLASKGGRFPSGTTMPSMMPLVCRDRIREHRGAGGGKTLRAYYFAIAMFVGTSASPDVPTIPQQDDVQGGTTKSGGKATLDKFLCGFKPSPRRKGRKKDWSDDEESPPPPMQQRLTGDDIYGSQFLRLVTSKLTDRATFQPHPLTVPTSANNRILRPFATVEAFDRVSVRPVAAQQPMSRVDPDLVDAESQFKSTLWYYNSAVSTMDEHWNYLQLQDLGVNAVYRSQVIHCRNSRTLQGPTGALLADGDILTQVEGTSLRALTTGQVRKIIQKVLRKRARFKPVEFKVISETLPRLMLAATVPPMLLQAPPRVDLGPLASDDTAAQAIVSAAETLDFQQLKQPEDLVAFAIGYAEKAGLMPPRTANASSPSKITRAVLSRNESASYSQVSLVTAALEFARAEADAPSHLQGLGHARPKKSLGHAAAGLRVQTSFPRSPTAALLTPGTIGHVARAVQAAQKVKRLHQEESNRHNSPLDVHQLATDALQSPSGSDMALNSNNRNRSLHMSAVLARAEATMAAEASPRAAAATMAATASNVSEDEEDMPVSQTLQTRARGSAVDRERGSLRLTESNKQSGDRSAENMVGGSPQSRRGSFSDTDDRPLKVSQLESSPYDNGVLALTATPKHKSDHSGLPSISQIQKTTKGSQELPAERPLVVGEDVFGLFKRQSLWYAGKLTAVDASSGVVSIQYNDGDVETGVEPQFVRRQRMYNVGDRVSAQYNGAAKWYSGRIANVHTSEANEKSSTYDIQFDDGDTDQQVDPARIRLLGEVDPTLADADTTSTTKVVENPQSAASLPSEDPAKEGAEVLRGIASQRPNVAAETDANSDDSSHSGVSKKPPGASASQNPDPATVDSSGTADGKRTNKPKSVKEWFGNIGKMFQKKEEQPGKSGSADGDNPTPAEDRPQQLPNLKVGDKILALFQNGQLYYPGKIQRVVQKRKFYDLKYEDGDKEQKVPAELVRLRVLFRTGDVVLAQSKKQTAWKLAKVTKASKSLDGESTVQFEDNVSETLLPQRIKPIEGPAPAFAGSHANMPNPDESVDDASSVSSSEDAQDEQERSTNAQTAKSKSSSEGPVLPEVSRSASSAQRKAEVAEAVGAELVSEEPSSADSSPNTSRNGPDTRSKAQADTRQPTTTKTHFQVDDKVLSLFDQGVKWYAGTITSVHSTSEPTTYDIRYDDGDSEKMVAAELVRPVTTYKIGDVVEGQYDAGTVWYKGKVVGLSENYDDSYSVLYDDGDREDDLEHVLMRPFGVDNNKHGKAVEASPAGNTDKQQAVTTSPSETEDWTSPATLSKEELARVRSILASVLGNMDKNNEPLSVKTARLGVEEQCKQSLGVSTWKEWFKKTAVAIMDEWDDSDGSGSESGSGSGSRSGSDSTAKRNAATRGQGKQEGRKSSSEQASTEYDTPTTTSAANLSKVSQAIESVMEDIEGKGEPMKASTIQRRVSDKLGQRKVDSPHWTKWFKAECQRVLDKWDDEDNQTGSDNSRSGDDEFPEQASFGKMTKPWFAQVKASVAKQLNAMNDKEEDLSLKVMRQRVEKELDTVFEGGDWKAWFKEQAQIVIDTWDESGSDSESGSQSGSETRSRSRSGGASGSGSKGKKAKSVALSDMSDRELQKIEDLAEDILEKLDEAGKSLSAKVVRETVEQKRGLSLEGEEWKSWFKDLCEDIIADWDAEDEND